nr:DNA (cytosine-5)-methyltransferase CMT3-like isoform X2 [Ipomoea batatas]
MLDKGMQLSAQSSSIMCFIVCDSLATVFVTSKTSPSELFRVIFLVSPASEDDIVSLAALDRAENEECECLGVVSENRVERRGERKEWRGGFKRKPSSTDLTATRSQYESAGVLQAKKHFTVAKVDGLVYKLGDDAYVNDMLLYSSVSNNRNQDVTASSSESNSTISSEMDVAESAEAKEDSSEMSLLDMYVFWLWSNVYWIMSRS